MTVANGSASKMKRLPVIGIVPSQNTTEKMVSFPERYADAIIKAGGAPCCCRFLAIPIYTKRYFL